MTQNTTAKLAITCAYLCSKQTSRVEEPSLRESMSAVSHWPYDLHLHISTAEIYELNGFEW